jgi:hypothetical protein
VKWRLGLDDGGMAVTCRLGSLTVVTWGSGVVDSGDVVCAVGNGGWRR